MLIPVPHSRASQHVRINSAMWYKAHCASSKRASFELRPRKGLELPAQGNERISYRPQGLLRERTPSLAEVASSPAFVGLVFLQNAALPLVYSLQEFDLAEIAPRTTIRLQFVFCSGTVRIYMGFPIHG